MRFHGEAASSAVEDAAVNYQSPSIIAAGANAHSVSVLATLVNLSLSLLCLKAPGFIERLGLSRKGAVTLAFLNLLAWVPLIIAFLLMHYGLAPGWLALLWLVNLMPALLLSVQRDNWLSNMVPSGSLGRYFGQRLAIRSAFYLCSFFLLGYLLDAFHGQTSAGFVIVFTIAFTAAFTDYIIFTYMRDPAPGNVPAPETQAAPERFGLFDFLSELKTKKLHTFISFTSLFYLTVGLSGPLYAVYMLQERHFTYLSFTMILAAEYLARIISVPFWGRLADKVGNIQVLGIVSRIIPLIPVFWLFNSHVVYLAGVQVISGICWGAYDLCTQNYLFRVAPRARKLRYIVYSRSLVLLCTAIGGLLGAYLVQGIFMTFGSRILSIFLISAVFRTLVVLAIMPRLVDLAVVLDKPVYSNKDGAGILARAIASRRGKYYQPPDQPMPNKKPGDGVILKKQRDQRRNWPSPKTPVFQPKEVYSLNLSTASRRMWHVSPSKAPAPPSLTDMQKKLIAAQKRPGLYYDNRGWREYHEESLRSIIKEKKTRPVKSTGAPRITRKYKSSAL